MQPRKRPLGGEEGGERCPGGVGRSRLRTRKGGRASILQVVLDREREGDEGKRQLAPRCNGNVTPYGDPGMSRSAYVCKDSDSVPASANFSVPVPSS